MPFLMGILAGANSGLLRVGPLTPAQAKPELLPDYAKTLRVAGVTAPLLGFADEVWVRDEDSVTTMPLEAVFAAADDNYQLIIRATSLPDQKDPETAAATLKAARAGLLELDGLRRMLGLSSPGFFEAV